MDILSRYNEGKGSNLDTQNSKFNKGYTSKVGSEIKAFPTTQPYTPKNTYIDSLTSQELIDRARDPFK